MNQLISIITPVYNGEKFLRNFFESFFLSDWKDFEIIINNDPRSVDNTEFLCEEYRRKGLKIIYKKENNSMAHGRKRGVDFSSGDILLHLDCDMKVTPRLLLECFRLINSGFDALVISEESYGTTFWAKCKWLEKRCYNGIDNIESARCFTRKAYFSAGGHNEKMIFSEDRDLDIRMRKAGFRIGRTENFLYHNEGDLRLLKTSLKKLGYSHTANIFQQNHPEEFKWQANPLNRYFIFLKNAKYFFSHPFLYIGMIYMKTCEYLFAGFGYLNEKFKHNVKNTDN
jgi:glycosyltransferase involved in cell wall biosynthesis